MDTERQPETVDLRKVSLTAEGAVVDEMASAMMTPAISAPVARQSLVRRELKGKAKGEPLAPGLGDEARLDAAKVAALTTLLFPDADPPAAGPERALMKAKTSGDGRQPMFPSPGEDERFEPVDRPDSLPQDHLGAPPPLMETPPRLHEWGRTDLLDPEMTALDNATIEAAAEAALEEEEIERNVVRDVQDVPVPGTRSNAIAVAAIAISVPLCLCVVFSVSGLGFSHKDKAFPAHRPGFPAEGGYAADASGEEAADDRGSSPTDADSH